MKKPRNFTVLFFSIFLFISCTIDENYSFNKDMSGHYSFNFDYSAILEFDTSGSANSEMEKGYIEMEEELKKIEGISNILILSNGEKGKVVVSYDFSDLDALNKTSYEKETGKYSKYFTKDGKKITFTADFSKELQEYTEPDMSLDELKENIQTMLAYTITFNFENEVKVLSTSNIVQKDGHTLSYILNEESLSTPSKFEIKLR